MIWKLQSGQYRPYSRKMDAKTGKLRNSAYSIPDAAAETHERKIQYFKRH